ncbi:ribosomal protein L13e, partial [Helicosporidium sp. ATCC 50920]
MAHRITRLTQECSRFRVVDAKGEVVGRLASRIAMTLMGKDKPTYVPRSCDGDAVIVVNAAQVELTGNKWEKKLYRWHTGYPGGLKERSAQDQHARDPTKVLREAVMGMLPKNLLRKTMSRRLRIYAGSEHEFEGAGAELVPFAEGKPRRMNRRPIPLEPGFFP